MTVPVGLLERLSGGQAVDLRGERGFARLFPASGGGFALCFWPRLPLAAGERLTFAKPSEAIRAGFAKIRADSTPDDRQTLRRMQISPPVALPPLKRQPTA